MMRKAADVALAGPQKPDAELPDSVLTKGVVSGYRTYLKAIHKKEELESAVTRRLKRLWESTGARCCAQCVGFMLSTPCIAACVASFALYVAVLLELVMGLTAVGDGVTLVTDPPATLAAVLLLAFATVVQMADTVRHLRSLNPRACR